MFRFNVLRKRISLHTFPFFVFNKGKRMMPMNRRQNGRNKSTKLSLTRFEWAPMQRRHEEDRKHERKSKKKKFYIWMSSTDLSPRNEEIANRRKVQRQWVSFCGHFEYLHHFSDSKTNKIPKERKKERKRNEKSDFVRIFQTFNWRRCNAESLMDWNAR